MPATAGDARPLGSYCGANGLNGELETIGGDGPDELGISPGMASTGADDLDATGDDTEEE